MVAQIRRLGLARVLALRAHLPLDDADVHIASRAKVVPNSGLDGLADDVDRLFSRHVGRPRRLEDGHRRERSGTHRNVGELVGRTVGSDGVEMRSGVIDPAEDESGSDMTLVSAARDKGYFRKEKKGGKGTY
jgi:hypothetical protein